MPVRWAAWGNRPHVLNQLVRYEPVVRLLSPLSGGRLLDVGSGSDGVGKWLGPRWSVVSVDVSFEDYGGAEGPNRSSATPVLGDVTRLPFGANAFEAVTCLDVIEHLPEESRSIALRELARVTASRLVVACPTGRAADISDRRLFDHLHRAGPGAPGWLKEHVENGLPAVEELVRPLQTEGAVRTFGNENVRAHERIMAAELRPRWLRVTEFAAQALAGAAVEGNRHGMARSALHLIRGRDRPPAYRTVVVLDREAGRRG